MRRWLYVRWRWCRREFFKRGHDRVESYERYVLQMSDGSFWAHPRTAARIRREFIETANPTFFANDLMGLRIYESAHLKEFRLAAVEFVRR